jgi:hypothetical protein
MAEASERLFGRSERECRFASSAEDANPVVAAALVSMPPSTHSFSDVKQP